MHILNYPKYTHAIYTINFLYPRKKIYKSMRPSRPAQLFDPGTHTPSDPREPRELRTYATKEN